MTYIDSKNPILGEARATVAEVRRQNPEGTDEQLIEALGSQFPDDWDIMLRAMPFRHDQDHAGTTAPDRR